MGRSVMIEHLQSQRDEFINQVDMITSLAMKRDDKSLTENERAAVAKANAELDAVNRELELFAHETDLSDRAKATIAKVTAGQSVPDGFTYRSGSEGQAIWDFLHRQDDDRAKFRVERVLQQQERAAEHMGTTAEATTPVAGGFGALSVAPVTGPIIQLYPTQTPFLTVIGARTITSGEFRRPRLVDPNLLTAAGPQAGGLEKGELPSKKWDYANDLVTPTLIGNYINLSYQAIELVPSALQQVVDHLRLRTALNVESQVVTEAGKTGATITLAADASAGETQQAVWDAMAQVFIATGQPAQWITVGPLGLAMLGGKVDRADRPLFPVQGATNAPGTADGFTIIQPWGLQLAVTPAITDTSMYVGNGVGLEAYVRYLPTLQVDEPSLYGRQIGVAALVGFYSPPTAEATDDAEAEHNAIVKIAPA